MAIASDGGAAARKEIIRTFWILFFLTALEFFIAFTWRWFAEKAGISMETGTTMKNVTYIILTLFKAFYIVSYFMHLKHELRRLILTILIPFAFIVWLIIGLIVEGNYWGTRKQASVDDGSIPVMGEMVSSAWEIEDQHYA